MPMIRILPLGTSSAIANNTRNQSSLALILPTQTTLLFDCGEGTVSQLYKFRSLIKATRISQIFITHLHGDHTFGLCPLIVNILSGHGGLIGVTDPRLPLSTAPPPPPKLELFGPVGLRAFIRANLRYTYAILSSHIRIHELHPTATPSGTVPDPTLDLHPSELPGLNLLPTEGPAWPSIATTPEYTVSAAPITHTCPSIGYVVQLSPERATTPPSYPPTLLSHAAYFTSIGITQPLTLLRDIQGEYAPRAGIPREVLSEEGIHLPGGRLLPRLRLKRGKKITVLGDTCDASAMVPLARYSDVVVHEATNAFLPGLENLKEGETYGTVEERTRSRGHSTPEMAGRFAAAVGLGEGEGQGGEGGVLVLNHFSSRYEDEGMGERAAEIMGAIRECAVKAWREGKGGEVGRVVCARDGHEINVK